MKTIETYIDNLKKVLEVGTLSLPDFENRGGLWVHNNQHTITVIKEENEIEEFDARKRPDWSILLGVLKLNSLKINEYYLFNDEIKNRSKRYSDHESIIIENGRIIGDLRKTMGEAITAKPTGLFEDDAFNYIEILCKIELTIIHVIYNNYGKWGGEFYSPDNIHFIDLLVCQLTEEVIKEDIELIKCFKWLMINGVKSNSFRFKEPIPYIKNVISTKEEWKLLNQLDIFINCFPIHDKDLKETWEEFFNRLKDTIQDTLVNSVKDHKSGWEIIEDYLTEENKKKYRGSITGRKFGLNPTYRQKWWKT